MVSNWNVLVFGSDLETPFAVNVNDPSIWTLANLKSEIMANWPLTSSAVKPSTVADFEVYCGEKKIAKGKPLLGLDGLRNGVGVMVTIKPFIINVYCSNDDVSLQVEVPRKEFRQWTVASLRSVICFKRGFDVELCQHDILAFLGRILADSSAIFLIPGMANDCLITHTRIAEFEYPQGSGQTASVPSPLGIGEEFASHNFFHKRKVRKIDLTQSPVYCSTIPIPNYFWTITVQTMEGSKAKVVLENPTQMSIFTLRELVMKATSVPTHKQRLTAGDTILEDWDEVGGAMLVVHYPKLYDGAIIYLVTLTDGIRVELNFCFVIPPADVTNWVGLNVSSRHKSLKRTRVWLSTPIYLNIHCPKTFKQSTLMSVMKSCAPYHEKKRYPKICQVINSPSNPPSMSREFIPSNDPVNVITWIRDGCILGLKDCREEPIVDLHRLPKATTIKSLIHAVSKCRKM